MKKIILKNLLVVLMFGTLTCYATTTGTSFTKENENVTKVILYNVKKGQFLFIRNTTGKIIHKELIKITGSVSQGFNFSSLENGYYTLEINKDYQIDVKPFTIISGQAIFHKKAEKTTFKPVMRNEKNLVLISKLNFEETPMQVTIYYKNEIIFRDTIEGEYLIEKTYTLLEEKKGSYKIVTKANDRKYIMEFSLK